MTLLTTETHTLWKANEALSKRWWAKKTCVCQGGALTVEDVQDILAQKDAVEQVAQDICENHGGDGSRLATIRRCGRCGKPGYNTRTCQVEEPMSDIYSSE